jgi:hypothetical protein
MKSALFALLLPCCALADTTLTYRGDDGCSGDFDQIQMKDAWLRMDTRQGGDNSMIYDGAEKLVTFVDHQQHRFMQTELDEDAIDLQKDIMSSLRTKMRRETGVDTFAMAQSLCPGMDGAASRDRLPDDAPACANGATPGAAMIGTDGKPMTQEQLEAAMKDGHMPAIDPGSQQMMQQMLQKQMETMTPEQQAQMQQLLASAGGAMLPQQAKTAPARPLPRIDRDAGELRVGDIACQRRQHLRGEQMLREDCYAPIAALAFEPKEARRIARFSKAMQEWGHSFSAGDTQQASDDRALIQRICYRDGHESGRTTLRIDHAPIAEARFALPSGYAPFDLGMGSPGSR